MDWENALEFELNEQLDDPDEWMRKQRASVEPESVDVSEQLSRHARMLQYMVDKLEQDPNWLGIADEIDIVLQQLKKAIRAAKDREWELTH